MQRLKTATLAVMALLWGGCGEAPIQLVDEAGERQAAIVNGTTYSGHPSVGMLQIDGSGLCTATLIGQKTVVTAAHCIGSSHSFRLGNQSYSAASAKKHPNWNSYTLENDIALVILQQAPSGVTRSAIATSAPAVGLEITLVGYGVTGEGMTNSGTKRMAKNKISQLSSTRFSFVGSGGSSGSTCYGDSGGPAFATLNGVEVQIGVTSAGQKPCGTMAYDTRIDAYASWIDQTSSGDVQKSGTAPDPNPNPNPNPTDTAPPAVAITSPAAGAVVQTPLTISATITDNVGVTKAELLVDGATISTLTAAPYQFQVNLAAGAHTLQVVGHDAAGNKGTSSVSVSVDSGATPTPNPTPDPTPSPAPAAGEYGSPCQGAADCKSALCAEDPAFEGRYCTQACDPNGVACPLGTGCFATNVSGKSVCGAPAQSLPITPGGSVGSGEETLAGSCSLAPELSVEGGLGALLLLLGLALLRRRS